MYRINYAYKRFGEWYTGSRSFDTPLKLNTFNTWILKKEIEDFEMVPVIILEIN